MPGSTYSGTSDSWSMKAGDGSVLEYVFLSFSPLPCMIHYPHLLLFGSHTYPETLDSEPRKIRQVTREKRGEKSEKEEILGNRA